MSSQDRPQGPEAMERLRRRLADLGASARPPSSKDGARLRRVPSATPLLSELCEPLPEPKFYPHMPTRMERLGGALGRILFAPWSLLRATARLLG